MRSELTTGRDTVTTAKTLLTAEDLFELPDDGRRYELLDGELKEMTPPGGEHGGVEANLTYLLNAHVRERGLGRVLSGDPGVFLRRNPDRVRAPDVCFIAAGRLPGDKPPAGYLEIVPDLIIEIISPNDKASDVQQKIEEWLAAGAKLVWALYPATHSIVAYRSLTDIRVYTEADTIDGSPVLPDFTCKVAELFS